MSDESIATPQETIREDAALTRVPRREALKGLGALAVSSTALAAIGCSSATDSADALAESSTTASQAGSNASQMPVSVSAQAGVSGSLAKPPASAIPSQPAASASAGVAGKPTSSAASAGSSSTAGSAAAGSANAGSANAGSANAGSANAGSANAGSANAGSTAAGSAATAGSAGAGAAATTDLSSLACILTPDMTEGPFFIEEKLNRSDLLMGESDESIVMATPLALTIGVYKVDGMTCTPLAGLQVDIWQADALGLYSDVASGFVQATDTRGKQFLRGFQVTNESGLVDFATIYPGWYMSRTIHIHFKIRMPMGGSAAYDFTSQMFFDEKISKEVLASGPYAKAPGSRSVFNEDDHIFNGTPQNGQQPAAGQKAPGLDTMVALSKTGSGFTGLLKVGLMI
jgi:protocatechuate 3,4-dioxygenase beta subunit